MLNKLFQFIADFLKPDFENKSDNSSKNQQEQTTHINNTLNVYTVRNRKKQKTNKNTAKKKEKNRSL